MKNKIQGFPTRKPIPSAELLSFITKLSSENIILLWEQVIRDETTWKKFSALCQYNSIFLSVLLRELYLENPRSSGVALLLYDLSGGNSKPYQQRYLDLFPIPSSELKEIIENL